MESRRKALKERLVTGCQLTNCLPPKIEKKKEPEDENLFIPKSAAKGEDSAGKEKRRSFELKLKSPELNDLKLDSPIHFNEDKKNEKEMLLPQTQSSPSLGNNSNAANTQTRSDKSLPETNSTLSLKNEVSETTHNEINSFVKAQNHNKMKEYEIISEKNEIEEKEQEDFEPEPEKETGTQAKTSQQVEPIFEREEKHIHCQPCKECSIF